ncbi:MAG: SBBP repeat-containing protein [Bacteroidales bacterium]|nr:SBBP repeat-containing protein [Bacteroidales bacterium]
MKIKRLFSTAILCIFIINANAQLSFQQNNLQEVEKAEVTAKVNKTKIPWIKNTGQQQSEVAFYAETFSGTVFVTNTGEIVYSLPIDSAKSYVLRESFIKTNDVLKKSDVYGELQSQTKVNYFTGNNSDNWQSNVPTFQTVNLGEVWDGIEVKLNAYGNNIEKLFFINPGVAPENIQLKLYGAKKLIISQTGELIIKTPEGNIKFTEPVAYQTINNKKESVEVAYTTKGKTYGFEVGKYNSDYELVIDPLIASTFVGGTGRDDSWFLALDNIGNVFITGETSSSTYPTTAGAYNTTTNGNYDVFVSKFSPDLQTLLISTFLGGTNSDYCTSLAFDSNNNIYITGNTWSNNFPMAGTPYDNSLSGDYDVFVAKLNSDLSLLLASTYIGGTQQEKAYSIAADNTGSIFITGFTLSYGYPTTSGAYDETWNDGGIDAFISKFDSDLSTLSASTFLGGSANWDYCYSLAIDSYGNVFVTGHTYSHNFPSAGTPYEDTFQGAIDGFISKFTPDLSTLSVSTFVGSSEYDYCWSIKLDDSDNVYVTGHTSSSGFPTSETAYDKIFNGEIDAFVSKFTSDLNTLSASTFIGGSGWEKSYSIDFDNSGNVFITGYTTSSDFPVSTTAYDNSYNGSDDLFISKFTSDLSSLSASTFLGGILEDFGSEIAVDALGNVFVTGYTTSNNYPVTASAYDVSYAGDDDVFISKFDNTLSNLPEITLQPENQSICAGNNAIFSLTATGADSYQWQENTGSGFENIIDGGIYNGAETDTLTITGVSLDMTDYQYQCVVTNAYGEEISNIVVLTVCLPVSISSHPENQTICEGNDTIFGITAINADSYKWQVNTGSNFENITDGDIYSGAETDTLTITGAGFDMNTYEYQCIASNLCVDITSNSAFLMVSPTVYITSQPENQTVCEGNDTIFCITATDVDNYQWQVNTGSSFEDITDDDIYSGAKTDTLIITSVTANMNTYEYQCIIDNLCGDITSNIAVLTINPLVSINSQPENQTICEGNDTIFYITATNADSYKWQVNTGSSFEDITDGDVYSGTETDTLTITSATANMNTYQYQCVAGNSCGDITSNIAVLTVNPLVSITSQPENQTICEGNDTIFCIAATNVDSYQWQVNTGSGFEDITDGDVYSGTETDTLTITSATANMNTYQYQCVAGNSCGDITSNIAVLTVNPLVSISFQPENQTICEGNDTIFCITATNADNYQWQVNTGSNFEDITDDDIYSGAETDTLTITGANLDMNDYQYQCIIANSCGDITSNIAVLTVHQLVSITSQPISQEIQEDSNAVFTVIANGDITAYQWRKNEIPLSDTGNISGTTTNELTISNISQNDAGNYDCVITGECNEVITNLVSLTVLTSIETIQNIDDIKIYPNPTNGIFTIEGKDIQSIEITNINGQTIRQYSIDNLSADRQDNKSSIVNLKGQPKGIYFVKIWNNDFITIKKIVVE